ncbi:MAG: 4-hydroxy-tetrahydrodipicolinate synthase [Maricaulaceae bacterium]
MALARFKGSITALLTPFKDGGVDEAGFQTFVEEQIRDGSHGLVPCGTTGESPTLSHEEHERVVALCVEASGGRVPVIAGAGSNSTEEAIALTAHAKREGADAALIVAPYYNKPSQEGLFAHFKAINDAVELPLFVYNIPGRSIVDITPPTMGRLAELPNVIGVKDATGDLARVTEQIETCGESFIQLSGDDPTSLAHYAMGGSGCISVTANIAASACAAFHEACLGGDYGRARALHASLAPLHRVMFFDPSPAPVKYAASLQGRCSPEVRLPLTPCRDATEEAVRAAMAHAGLSVD